MTAPAGLPHHPGGGRALRPDRGAPVCARVVARLDVKPTLGCVKGVRYDGLRLVGDPRALAQRYEAQGADELYIVDVVASLYGRRPHLGELRWATQDTLIPGTYAGGIRSLRDVVNVTHFAAVDKVALNTAAVARPELITEIARTYGSQAAMVHVDAKGREGWWEAYTHGGRQPSGRDAVEWACEAVDRGAGELVLGSVDRDGTRRGLDLDFLGKVLPRVSVPVVVTGGAGSPEDVVAALRAGASGVAVATMLHAGGDIGTIKAALVRTGVEIRA